MHCEFPRSIQEYVAVSRHRDRSILGGTSSGCIDRIDNSILNLYLARTQQCEWRSQGRQRLDAQRMKIAILPPSHCSQHPGRTCCMCVLCRIDSELMAAYDKHHIAVLEAPQLIVISCLWFERKSTLRLDVIIAFELPRLSSPDLLSLDCLLLSFVRSSEGKK